MPPVQRDLYCEKLSASIAMSKFSNDIGKSVKILSELSNNPNLPPSRKRELYNKARNFKDSVEITLELERQQNEPLNTVLSQINIEGRKVESRDSRQFISNSKTQSETQSIRDSFFDCADEVYCNEGAD